MGWPVFQKLLLAAGIALLAFFLWRLIAPWIANLHRPANKAAHAPWTPDRGAALALLEDADRLAAEGRYDEATHLLLQRSVEQISAARPGLLHPASTAREIAASPSLPATASLAFGIIAGRVERSRFALRALAQDDWHVARKAYADFAAVEMA